jgi:hypothetical protein
MMIGKGGQKSMSSTRVQGCRQVSGRESLVTQKRQIAISGTHELTDASSRTDPTVEQHLPVHREMSVDQNGICVGEHR